MTRPHWARKHGIPYRTAWKWFKQGILPARAIQLPTGTILVLEEEEEVRLPQDAAAIYTRVSVHEARDDLERQVQRLQDYAAARGYRVVRVVKEVASGLNDRRPRLEKLLLEKDYGVLLVEHRDRLTRFGFHYLELLLHEQGKRVEVVNEADTPRADLIEDFVEVIYSFAARLYGLRGERKARKIVSELVDEAREADG
ncbi:resolvase [Thermus scotoductus]|uniref:Resolvase n=1 Tax=Thermus scotoductus TaxID=37636 RepID=A0A0N0ZS49_THESC|nr:resolvase [Thermus scotoductus]